MEYSVPQDKQDPNIIMNTARTDAALPKPSSIPEDGAKSATFRSHLGRLSGEEIERDSPCTMAKVVKEQLGRPVQLAKNPAVKGKPTGMALRVPAIDVLWKRSTQR